MLNLMLLLEPLNHVCGHLSFLGAVGLAPYQEHDSVIAAILSQLSYPYCAVLQSVWFCDVVGQDDTLRASVEDLGNRLKTLLPSRVPDLELDNLLLLHSEHEGAELHSDCHFVVLSELLIRRPQENT